MSSDDPVQAVGRRAPLPIADNTPVAASAPSGALEIGDAEGQSSGSHRSMLTAQEILNLLTLRAQGLSSRQISAQLKLILNTVEVSVRANQWSSGKIQARLARLPDYPQFREQIQGVVRTLGLTTAELPPPAAVARNVFTAGRLAAALEMVIDRDKLTLPKGRFLEHVAQAVGLSHGGLRRWINAEGKLLRPPSSVRNLPGFDEHADRLQECFSKLNQPDVIDALADGAPETRKKMTTEFLVTLLGDLLREPNRDLTNVAHARNSNFTTLRKYIMPDGALRISPEKLAGLTDYAEHVDDLRNALVALGQTQQAESLKPATMPATGFLDLTRKHFGRVMAITERLAVDPSADPFTEARRMEVPMPLLAVLFEPSGALRPEADIRQRLSDLKPYQQAGVSDMLARIAQRHAGVTTAEPEMGMKRIDMVRGGTIPDRVLIVGKASVDPGAGNPRRLENIYAGSADLVRGPRSYAPDRHRQVLRWLSTVLKQRFPESIEVQSYFDAEQRKIVVSSNRPEENRNIRQFLRDGGLARLFEAEGAPASSPDMTARELRHLTKLTRRMDRTIPAGSDAAEAVLAAIAEGRIEVPKRTYNWQGSGLRMHAERRIKDHVAKQGGPELDLAQLAGTMRPCGTCASELKLPPQAHRGPFWKSAPARYGVDIENLIRQNQLDGVGTSITRTREEVHTFDVDTDSDSDAEPPHPNLTVFTTPR